MAWMYNWLDDTWSVQEFIDYNHRISSCLLYKNGNTELVVTGFLNFNLQTGKRAMDRHLPQIATFTNRIDG